MTSWLSKQKKNELQAMASRVGIAADGLKDEIVTALDEKLKSASAQFSNDKMFAEYYERAGSPVKKTKTASAPAEDTTVAVKEPKRRKTTASKPEASSPTGASSSIMASPAIRRISAAMPSSPAISRSYSNLTRGVTKQYNSLVKKSSIRKHTDSARAFLSNVDTIYTLLAIIEALGLRRATFPLVNEETTTIKGYGPYIYWRPNFPTLFSSIFWAPTTLWALTSVILPLAAAYFFNLTFANPRSSSRRSKPLREFDPMTFAVVKALTTWFVYSPDATFRFGGLYSTSTVSIVKDFVYGGYFGMYVGAAIGVLASLYDHISYKS